MSKSNGFNLADLIVRSDLFKQHFSVCFKFFWLHFKASSWSVIDFFFGLPRFDCCLSQTLCIFEAGASEATFLRNVCRGMQTMPAIKPRFIRLGMNEGIDTKGSSEGVQGKTMVRNGTTNSKSREICGSRNDSDMVPILIAVGAREL